MKLSPKVRETVLPLLAALIWGTAFVAQKKSTTGALTFTFGRSLIAVLFLLVLLLLMEKGHAGKLLKESSPENTRKMWIGGILCGIALTSASYFQQHGMDCGTEAGKASFITAFYMVLVPVFGLFFGKKTDFRIWIAVLLALAGLYCLCISDGFKFKGSDLYVLICAFLFTAQIMLIDTFSPCCNPVKLSCIQFMTCSVISGLLAVCTEGNVVTGIAHNLMPLLYLGIFSSGIAYTLQMVAQKNTNPAVVSVLLSMESLFGVLSGALILHERLETREYLGCVIMFIAVMLTQLDVGALLHRKRT